MKSGWLAAALLAAALLLPDTGCSPAAGRPASAAAAPSRAEEVSSAPPLSEAPASSSGTAASSSGPALSSAPDQPPADPSFLDDAVFVGDSVTLKLKNYVTQRRKSDPSFFGKARFLTAGSMGSGNALQPVGENSIHPLYNGEKALLEDSAAKMGAKKVYLMLGINDLAPYGVDGAAANLEKLGLRFLQKQPGASVWVQSATPMLQKKQMRTLNNQNIAEYNGRLREICRKEGWAFLDIASVLSDAQGALKPEYCSDPDDLGLHFTDEACEIWIRYILTHTKA